MEKSKLLQVGDTIELCKGMTVYAVLPQHFCYGNRWGVFNETARHEMKIGSNMMGFDTTVFAGRYRVTETKQEGGGSQLGMNGFPDVWPNGHHVFAQLIREEKGLQSPPFVVDFYQTGCFTAMIPPEKISPIA